MERRALNRKVMLSERKVMIEPNEAMSDKHLFRPKPRFARKCYSSPTQVSLSVAKTFSGKKEVSSKNTEHKVSLEHSGKRVSSKGMKNKDIVTSLQSDLWSSSFLKESTGEGVQDAVMAKQEKSGEFRLQGTDDKLSESTDDDGEDGANDANDKDINPRKEIRAPLELMAEFLRAEMGRDYHLAKKLCQMILIYEPENPEAKEFLSLIEEMLLKEKERTVEEEDEDSEEESSDESSEAGSDESSGEWEEGS
ncbi:glutamate-rich protein 2 [Lepus europaeus]|uniref:glutamate-rich protein 2 n=1 Tax=Lepus europaeus TaxID=9983 RepID=UPI002B47377B|nr:glutamate-rich protein 2 [Lepus europaeus]